MKEESAELPPVAPPRAALPSGVPNYVTERGLELLRSELDALTLERTRAESTLDRPEPAQSAAIFAQRRAQLEERIASAIVVVPRAPADEVRFGTSVVVLGEDGVERTFRLVGVDEADPAQGRIAFVSPVARALLGRRAGDVATVRTPRGEETLEVISVTS